jgi:hypothetical protein
VPGLSPEFDVVIAARSRSALASATHRPASSGARGRGRRRRGGHDRAGRGGRAAPRRQRLIIALVAAAALGAAGLAAVLALTGDEPRPAPAKRPEPAPGRPTVEHISLGRHVAPATSPPTPTASTSSTAGAAGMLVLDLTSHEVFGRVPLGKGLANLAIDRWAENRLGAANPQRNTITEIDTDRRGSSAARCTCPATRPRSRPPSTTSSSAPPSATASSCGRSTAGSGASPGPRSSPTAFPATWSPTSTCSCSTPADAHSQPRRHSCGEEGLPARPPDADDVISGPIAGEMAIESGRAWIVVDYHGSVGLVRADLEENS